jgi:hypothetical protein
MIYTNLLCSRNFILISTFIYVYPLEISKNHDVARLSSIEHVALLSASASILIDDHDLQKSLVPYSHRQKSYLVDGAPRPAALIGLAYSRMCMFVMAFSDWTVQGEPIVWNERSSTTCEATAREQQANRGEPLKIWRTKVSPALGGSSPEKDISGRGTVWVISGPVAI